MELSSLFATATVKCRKRRPSDRFGTSITKQVNRRRYKKPPLAEAQTALGKQKSTFCRTPARTRLSHYRNSVKSRFLAQNFTESDNRLLSYGQKKRFLKWRPSAIFNLKKNNIWSSDRHRVPNLHLCTKFYRNLVIFR